MDSPIDPRRYLNNKEFKSVVGASRQLHAPLGLAIRFIAATGVRIGEALLIRFDDLLLDEVIPQVLVPTMKRNGRPRRAIHLYDEAFVEELRQWRTQKDRHASLIDCGRRTLQRAFADLKANLNLRKLGGIHILRHTRVSQLVNAGLPYNYIRFQLGWTRIEPLVTYDHRDLATIEHLAVSIPKLPR